MTTDLSPFDALKQVVDQDGTAAALDSLAARLRSENKYHELFEALKMRVRHRLGLPLTYNDLGDDLDAPARDALEAGLLEACREVGELLLADGHVREGWMYMRPIGNRNEVARLLADIEATDENLDELIEICLNEGVDPARGYALVLENHGTCNAITTFESSVIRMPKSEQQSAAALLVRHVHQELIATVKADITQQQGAAPAEGTLALLVADRPWLFGEYAYHIDTTHLASTVRFARVLDDPELLELALDLVEYGRHLNPQFQYPGEEPFGELYESHAAFLGALL